MHALTLSFQKVHFPSKFQSLAYTLFGIIFCLLSSIQPLAADPTESEASWYQIEYIIVEHLQTDDHILRYEDVPYPLSKDKAYSYVTHLAQPASPYQYPQISDELMVLNDAAKKLQRSREIQILDMKAWQQPLPEGRLPYPLKIDVQVGPTRQLFGELQLSKSRYTHADFKVYLANTAQLAFTDLKAWLLTEKSAWSVSDILSPISSNMGLMAGIGSTNYFHNIRYVNESRRIKEGEVHYIDHPTIGIIVTIKEVPSPHELNFAFEN